MSSSSKALKALERPVERGFGSSGNCSLPGEGFLAGLADSGCQPLVVILWALPEVSAEVAMLRQRHIGRRAQIHAR